LPPEGTALHPWSSLRRARRRRRAARAEATVDDPVSTLATTLEALDSGFLVVLTGAGISLASGIPTFRGSDPGAVWKRDVLELGTRRYFESDPAGSWTWYTSRFDQVLDKQPNAAHHALAALERWQVGRGGGFVLVTQNVDPLHERAGSERLVKVHGSAERVRCSRQGCRHGAPGGSLPRAGLDFSALRADPVAANVPRCPACGALLRQHVLWFDEYYDEHHDYQWPWVLQAAQALDCLLCVGTSFSVGVTELFLRAALGAGKPVLSVDPGAAASPHPRVTVLRAASEVLLPAVCQRLGAGPLPPPS
jgi:NAD-dependent deacetylase